MNDDTYPQETLELIYNEVKDRLNTQLSVVGWTQYKGKRHYWICWRDNWNIVTVIFTKQFISIWLMYDFVYDINFLLVLCLQNQKL